MKHRLAEHGISIILITVLMVAGALFFEGKASRVTKKRSDGIEAFAALPISSINDPLEKELVADCLNIFYPDRPDSNTILLNKIYHVRQAELNRTLSSSSSNQTLSLSSFVSISGMYFKFFLVYVVVMFLTYYGVQSLGALRFVLRQQTLHRYANSVSDTRPHLSIPLILLTVAKVAAYLILFSPAYVIAYSIRTEFNTDSTLFMILLGVISNGLLVMYTNKFFTFLVAESRKGYVENALVKNLSSNYSFSSRGIPLKLLFSLKKNFDGHVFGHIFNNARYQYLSTIKEQASFLITGLVIIEMALNIHGHLTYELLRQLLYHNYSHVIIIMLFIFYTVKITDIFTDLIVHRESKRYENR